MRILEKNGVDNTNIDGAGFNRFCAGNRDGIIKGRLNECAIAVQGNALTIGTGEMLVSGFRVVIDTPTTFTMSSTPTSAQRYQVIAEIVVDGNSEPTFSLRTQLVAELKQDALFSTEAGVGTYQVELCKFTHTTSGNIDDLLRTIDVITGGSGTSGGGSVELEIGTVSTETLDAGMDAEVDVETRTENGSTYVDWRFGLPRGLPGPDGIGIASVALQGLKFTITYTDGEADEVSIDTQDIVIVRELGTVDGADTVKMPDGSYKSIKEAILALAYPVGTIYASVNNTSPASFLGGTWEALTTDATEYKWKRTA